MFKNPSIFFTTCIWLWFIQLGVIAQGIRDRSNESRDKTQTQEKEESAWSFSGHVSQEYRLRHSSHLELAAVDGDSEEGVDDDETDQDLRLSLSGYLWEKSDHFAGDLSMGLWHDLDGETEVGRPSSFGSVDDHDAPQSWHDPFDVYSLYGEYHSPYLLSLLRAGRQTSEYGRPITFDGAAMKLNVLKPYLEWAVFGGRTVHFFEIKSGLFENWLASTAIALRPLPSLRIEADYRYASEQHPSDEASAIGRVDDHCYGLAVWYAISSWAWLKGYLRGMNNAASNAGGGARLEWIQGELGIDAKVDGQLTTLRAINQRDDPYFEVLGESLEHIKIHIDAFKALATDFGQFSAHFGWQERMLTNDKPNRFNRDFGRIYLFVQASDIVLSGPFAGLTVEYNYSLSSDELPDNSLFAVGGSAGYKWNPIQATVGSYYYRYKYDYYIDPVELENVRSYFGECRYDPFEWLSLRLNYLFEQFDRDLHSVTLRLVETY
ncbi:MAG: hypothetical protein JXA30_20150 [Deltaproteobacteria bacterium]|nr:hypothetical protein [Deltaproteobacteria bacterium]